MQCKDIPDGVFLAAVRTASRLTGGGWVMLWDLGCVLAGNPGHLNNPRAHDEYPLGECFPWRLTRAKADKLIRRGVLEGCSCGCRGDFYIPGEWPVENQAKVLVAPANPEDWRRAGWKELGFTTEDGLSEPSHEDVWRIPPGKPAIKLDLTGFTEMMQAVTMTFQATARAFQIFTAQVRRRPERVTRMRADYHRKRGRRRFR